MKSPRLRRPLRFTLSITGDTILGVPAYQLLLHLREAARQVSHLVNFEPGEASPHSVQITNEKIEVKVGGVPGFTLHMASGCPPYDASATLHCDVMLGIGLGLDRLGHRVEAAGVITPFLTGGRLTRDLKTAFPLARCLARANQMHQALEIAEHFFGNDSTVDAAQVFLMPFLTGQLGLLNSERDFGARVLSRIAAVVEHRGDNVRASVLHYSRANLLRSMSRFRESIRGYRGAAQLDAAYLNRPYFWRELAGVLFLSRRYALAAKLYERSLALEQHRLTRLLHADALMFAGKYSEAKAIFDQDLESPVHPDDAEWALKRFALSWLREVTRIDEQQRRDPVFPDAFRPKELQEAQIDQICLRALEFDALCALAWFNLGGVHYRTGGKENAAKCFLLSALVVPWDLESWHKVIALALQTRDTNLLGHALCAAYQSNGEEFLRYVADRVPEKRAEFVAMLAQVVDQVPSRSRSLTIRTHHADGQWDEVVISR